MATTRFEWRRALRRKLDLVLLQYDPDGIRIGFWFREFEGRDLDEDIRLSRTLADALFCCVFVTREKYNISKWTGMKCYCLLFDCRLSCTPGRLCSWKANKCWQIIFRFSSTWIIEIFSAWNESHFDKSMLFSISSDKIRFVLIKRKTVKKIWNDISRKFENNTKNISDVSFYSWKTCQMIHWLSQYSRLN